MNWAVGYYSVFKFDQIYNELKSIKFVKSVHHVNHCNCLVQIRIRGYLHMKIAVENLSLPLTWTHVRWRMIPDFLWFIWRVMTSQTRLLFPSSTMDTHVSQISLYSLMLINRNVSAVWPDVPVYLTVRHKSLKSFQARVTRFSHLNLAFRTCMWIAAV